MNRHENNVLSLYKFGSVRFGSGKLLPTLASTVILGSGSRGTEDHIFLSPDSGSRATTLTPNYCESR
jgi:hypothetical protein